MTGFFDNVKLNESVGSGIRGVIQPVFSYFGMPGGNKQFLMARPTFIATDTPTYTLYMLIDFKEPIPGGAAISKDSEGSKWDISNWDESYWTGGMQTFQRWVGTAGVGYTGAVYMESTCVGDTFLASIDYLYEPGGPW